MAKIFGYSGLDRRDWFVSDAYTDREIESIKDPEGGKEISLPTAIPSPFARIDLVKTAFRNIVKSSELKPYIKEGKVIAGDNDAKLVSDVLDLIEILFNIDNFKENLSIIAWDKNTEISKLKQSSQQGHKQLAETLELFFEQDKESYNFDLVRRLYLVKYDNKIIGCSSPATLFFVTANDLKHLGLKSAKHVLYFGDRYVPLYEREPEFQKYLHLLFRANPLLQNRLEVVYEYLEQNLRILDRTNHRLYQEIHNLDITNFVTKYSDLDMGNSGDVVDVIGVTLRKRKREDIVNSIRESDFVIKTSKYEDELRPLVLQNNLNKAFRYANENWDNSIEVPYLDNESVIKNRRLPSLNIQYPYLTVSDFLEPYLIRLVYPINKDKFFDGNLKDEIGKDSKEYILPLKRLFFDFFDSDDLLNTLPDKPRIKMIKGVGGSVKVTLDIPIQKEGEFISFERMYYYPDTLGIPVVAAIESDNKGAIVEQEFGVTLFPFIKTKNPDIEAFYRIHLVDRNYIGNYQNIDYDLKFFSNSEKKEIKVKAKKIRRKKGHLEAGSQFYVLDKEFDFIQVKNTVVSGVIIPKWQIYQYGSEVFSFAVDFGTTNTHIEYKVGNISPKPFDITRNDVQIATLFDPNSEEAKGNFNASSAIEIRELIDYEFVPLDLGPKSESKYKFPQRTVLAENHSLDIENETFALADFNIPFVYERRPEKDKIQSNLKWAKKERGNEKRITAYFENILMLLRNKVLLNKGNLSQTRLVWFYPSSMKPGRKAELENTWNELFSKYFNPSVPAVGIIEALAPFYYFKGTNRLNGGAYKPVVAIDIGGGTTDVVVYKANTPLLLTSFKFAANAIFGDGYSEYGAANANGLISKYSSHYENLFRTNLLPDLPDVLSQLKEQNKSDDINAFFFSIETNPNISDKKTYSYNSLLARDEDLKIIFIYFYTAIIYHIAELLEQQQIELPKHIIFSGTGSKILSIITSDVKILTYFSKLIFEKVYNGKFDLDGLSIELEKDIPKEITCKGGLMLDTDDLSIDVNEIKKNNHTCLSEIEKPTYEQLDNSVKSDITVHVANFNEFFLQLNEQYEFADYFNVSPESLQIFKNESNKHLRDYLEQGLQFNKRMDNIPTPSKEVEETLFFYPLIGVIGNLINHLSKISPVNS